MRIDDKSKNEDMINVCFICGFDREFYSKQSKGFKGHIREDHNMWNYLFYISYIRHKDSTELTGIESYVKECFDKKNIDWFPILRFNINFIK